MGVAAYNRGSKVIRERADAETHAMRFKAVKRVPTGACEVCGGPLGVRADRGCAWDRKSQRWVDACFDCKRHIETSLA